MKLYHVSPMHNRSSIRALGIDPLFSTGKRQRSWYVDRERLYWAIIHTSHKTNLSVNSLDVWVVDSSVFPRVVAFATRGLFWTGCRVKAAEYFPASEYAKRDNANE